MNSRKGGGDMNCPKCQEGTIDKIIFKKSNKGAYVCDLCESLWMAGETDEDLSYIIDDAYEKDREHQPIRRAAI